jgi:hypothetical protein
VVAWFAQNSAAVQAFAAIAQVMLTLVLAGATIRYVMLTSEQLEELRKQQIAATAREAAAALAAAARVKEALRNLPRELPEGFVKDLLERTVLWNEPDVDVVQGFADRFASVPESRQLRNDLAGIDQLRRRFLGVGATHAPATSPVDRMEWQNRTMGALRALDALELGIRASTATSPQKP